VVLEVLVLVVVEDSMLDVVVVTEEVVFEVVVVGEVAELVVELVVWVDSGVTVNAVAAMSPAGLPVAVMTYAPAAMLATVNAAVSAPLEIEQVELLTGLPDNEQATSVAENPEPDTCTGVPGGPKTGYTAIEGGLSETWKLAAARPESAPLVATTTEYDPAGELATMNEPDSAPPEIEQV
jgi:hypothetical protein